MNKPLNQIIEESVQGEHDAWPLDPAYKVKGSYEDRYREGDNQIVLWEIYRCAKEGSAIPDWAALYTLPDDILANNPETKLYKFTKVDDQIVLVDPTKMRVIAVIDPKTKD
jgi:hypothetical protein